MWKILKKGKTVNGETQQEISFEKWLTITETFKCANIKKTENQNPALVSSSHKPSQSVEKECKNYKIIEKIDNPNEDLCIIVLQSNKSQKTIKIITSTFSGTLLKTYRFALDHLKTIYCLYSKQLLWIVSDLGIVQHLDLLRGSNVKRVWGEPLKEKISKKNVWKKPPTGEKKLLKDSVQRDWGQPDLNEQTLTNEQNLTNNIFFTEGCKIQDSHLILRGRYISFKSLYLTKHNELFKDGPKCPFFIQTLQIVPKKINTPSHSNFFYTTATKVYSFVQQKFF